MISVSLQGMPVNLHYSVVNLDLIAQVGRATLANAFNENSRELLCKRESKVFIGIFKNIIRSICLCQHSGIGDSPACFEYTILYTYFGMLLKRTFSLRSRAFITFFANVSGDSDPEAISVLGEIDLEALHLWQ